MPGLVGFAARAFPNAERSTVLQGMQDAICHQPFYACDGIFETPAVCGTRAHLGTAQPGAQPFVCDGACVWLDGEFFNQHELKQKLDHEADCDASILLGLVRATGDFTLLPKIDGIYSAVIYLPETNTLHLISDRYGLRSLYWSRCSGGVAWASEQKALLGVPGVSSTLDTKSVEDFLDIGHLTDERSWFTGTELVPPGSVLSFVGEERRARHHRYWSWQDIRPVYGQADPQELALEVARRFRTSVHRRARPGERVGVTLSGGLDSRAIVAALPDHVQPVHAFSFGKAGCADLTIAARVAALAGAEHHVHELGADNWLAPCVDGVWWSEGELNLLHMHGLSMVPEQRSLYDFNLNGFLGDVVAGGSYLNAERWSESEAIQQRGRRFVMQGPRLAGVHLEHRLPFMANDLVELLLAIPVHERGEGKLYHRMLLATFPEYFETIPWQTTGLPISLSPGAKRAASLRRKIGRRARRAIGAPDRDRYTDYPRWLREAPARPFFESLLCGREPVFRDCLPKEVGGDLLAARIAESWQRHQKGEDHAEQLGRYATLELWLRRLFRDPPLPR